VRNLRRLRCSCFILRYRYLWVFLFDLTSGCSKL
jgi:hypothetical protein